MADRIINVTVWNEYIHEVKNPKVGEIYPDGIHGAIAAHLEKNSGLNVRVATLDMPEHGLTDDVLNSTDVLIWWGHVGHAKVSDEIVTKVYDRIQRGMGFIGLHSAHASKIFRKLCGTDSNKLKWREDGDKERLWVVNFSHPITKGIGEYIEIEHEEVYGERFEIPEPDELLFISWFEGGEVFRSGFTMKRGNGKIFYFRPGHETYPIFHHEKVLKVIENAVIWAAPNIYPEYSTGHVKPLEKVAGVQ